MSGGTRRSTPARAFDEVTEKALEDAKAVVVLWSKHSVDLTLGARRGHAGDRYDTLVPVMIEPCNRPIMFELTHTADLSGWNGDVERRALARVHRRIAENRGQDASISASRHGFRPAAAVTDAGRRMRTPSRTHRYCMGRCWPPLIALGAGLYLVLAGPRMPEHQPLPRAAPATTMPATLASVAVLPFRDMSQNKDQEYFADGVTEEILNSLAGLKDLKVTARTSAFAFKGKDVDLRTVGETLGVQHILEGSIRKDGEQLRITAQLIDAKSDAHLWSKTYDRPLKDIFTVQEDIARSVAEALQVCAGRRDSAPSRA